MRARRILSAAGSVLVGAAMLRGGVVRGASVADVTESLVNYEFGTNYATTIAPIIYEDDDFSNVIDSGATDSVIPLPGGGGFVPSVDGLPDALGDIVRGIVRIPSIDVGDTPDSTDIFDTHGVQNINKTTPDVAIGGSGLGATGNNELTVVFELEVTGFLEANSGGNPFSVRVVTFGPTGGLGTLVADTTGDVTSDAIFAIYEDTTPDFTSNLGLGTAGSGDDLDHARDGTLLAVAGFSHEVGDEEFYYIKLDGSTNPNFVFSLNFLFLDATFPLQDLIVENDHGTQLAGSGSNTAGSAASKYDFNSDGDFKMLFAPMPTAFGPGLGLLACIGIAAGIRSRRSVAI